MRRFRFIGDPMWYGNYVQVDDILDGDFCFTWSAHINVEYLATKSFTCQGDWEEVFEDKLV